MTIGSAGSESSSVTMKTFDLGRFALEAPLGPPVRTVGTHGEMWQWIGDGAKLISLVVAVRPSERESVDGLRNRLLAEVERVGSSLRLASDREQLRPEAIDVNGAFAAFSMSVDGIHEGIKLHNVMLVATGGASTFLAHVAVPDTGTARQVASSILSSLRLLG